MRSLEAETLWLQQAAKRGLLKAEPEAKFEGELMPIGVLPPATVDGVELQLDLGDVHCDAPGTIQARRGLFALLLLLHLNRLGPETRPLRPATSTPSCGWTA